MIHKWLPAFAIFVLVGCAPAAPGGGAPTEQPADDAPAPWDDAYMKVPADLCPPEKEPVGQPVFAAPTQIETQQPPEVWVQHGLFVNEQGELFRIAVYGLAPQPVLDYAAKVRICLDQIFMGETTQVEPGQEGPAPEPSSFGENPEDLIVEVYLLGFADLKTTDAESIYMALFAVPVEGWMSQLKEMQMSPDLSRPEEFTQDYVIDFVIDPTANNGARHNYREKSVIKAWANVSVAGGGGSVLGKLCRNSNGADTTAVTKGGIESDTLSHNNGVNAAIYDLGTRGNANGTYRVSGRWGWPGWSAAYTDPAPPDRLENCPA